MRQTPPRMMRKSLGIGTGNGFSIAGLAICLAIIAACGVSWAQNARPEVSKADVPKSDTIKTDLTASKTPANTVSVPTDAFAERPISGGGGAIDAQGARGSPVDLTQPATGFGAGRVVLALGGVIALIFVMRTFARRLLPGVIAPRATAAMKIVSRINIAPRQHLLLLQVGKRLVVVGDGGTQLNPLCEITDADEVSAMLAQIRDESISAACRFDTLFGRARKGFGASEKLSADVTPDTEGTEIESAAARSALLEPQIAAIPGIQSVSVLPDETALMPEEPEAVFDSTHEIHDPAIDATRQELSGLSQKLKDLAKQLGGA